MKSLKSTSIAIAMCFLYLFGIGQQSSDAEIEIIDMDTPSETYNDGWFYHHVYVKTDVAYDVVVWYIGDPDDVDSLQRVGETSGDGTATRAWFYPDVSDCPGHIKGKKYRVVAEAWHHADDGNGLQSWSDSESRDFTVFQSISTTEVETPPKKLKSVSGYSKLTRQYYTGSSIAIDCSVHAYYPHNTFHWASSRFRHTLTGRNPIEVDNPGKRIGEKYGRFSYSRTLTHYDIDLERGGRYTSGAYVRLIVSGPGGEDHYLIENSATFTRNDKPYDAPD